MSQNQLIVSNKSNLIPSAQEIEIVNKITHYALVSQLLGAEYKGDEKVVKAKAMMIALKGLEIGMAPMQALTHLYIVKGRVGIMAEGMLALVYKHIPGAIINFIEMSSQQCVIKARRPNEGSEFATITFTMDDAKKAGLLSNGSWGKYPRAMLRSRCVAETCRSLFPDALCGMSYTPEELGAEVDEEGVPTRDVTNSNKQNKESPPPEKVDAPSPEPSHSHRKENDLDAASAEPGGGTTLENGRHGDYVFPSGRNAGKKMRDIVPEQLRKMVEFAEIDGARPEWGSHFIENATGYLEQLEAEKALSLD